MKGASFSDVIMCLLMTAGGVVLLLSAVLVTTEAYAQWATTTSTFTPVQFGEPPPSPEQQANPWPPSPALQPAPVWCEPGETAACKEIEYIKNQSQLNLQKIATASGEPYIGNFLQIYRNCDQSIDKTFAMGGILDTIKTAQCRTAIDDAENIYCGIRNYDQVTCGYITILKEVYELKVLELSY